MVDVEAERIVREKFLNEFCDGYVYVGQDKNCLPRYYTNFAASIKDFEVRHDDIIVASYPKSGTTWTQEMVWMIGNDLNFEKGRTNIMNRFPFFEVCCLENFTNDVPENIRDSIEFTKQQNSPRFIKTHLPFSLLPDQIKNETKKPKIIYVTRNPKDVCVSYYHHHTLYDGIRANLDEFTKVFLSGKEVYGPYWKHILGYWEHRNWPNTLFIKYEDMKKDLKAVMKTVASFLNKELSETQIERLSKHLSFESMKRNSSIDYDAELEDRQRKGIATSGGSFFRSGTVGKYKEELSVETIDKMNEWIESNISGTSFDQNYDYKF